MLNKGNLPSYPLFSSGPRTDVTLSNSNHLKLVNVVAFFSLAQALCEHHRSGLTAAQQLSLFLSHSHLPCFGFTFDQRMDHDVEDLPSPR